MNGRIAAGLFFTAIAVISEYEAYSIVFRGSPTISKMMAYHLTAHGWMFGLPLAFAIGAACLALFLHFAGLISIWKP